MFNLLVAATAMAMAAWAFWATKEKPVAIRVEKRSLDTVDERLTRGPMGGFRNP